MPISKIPVGAIQSGTIATTQIADNAVTTAKILDDNVTSAKIPNDAVGSTEIASSAITRDELQSAAVNNISSDSIILNSTNGTADAGDFLVLDGTDGAGANANHRILFDETFVDKIGLFNINSLGSGGEALKVNSAGTGFEFGAAGTMVKLATASASSSSEIAFDNTVFTSTYKSYMIRVNDFILSTNANFHFADSPDNGSTFSFTSKQGNFYVTMGASGYNASYGSNTNFHSFEGWLHDATSTLKTNYLELYLPYFTQPQVNKLYHAIYLHQNNNGNPYRTFFGFESSLTTAQNYIKFMGASGNITKGEFTVYGIIE